jgi:hypothetical protein
MLTTVGLGADESFPQPNISRKYAQQGWLGALKHHKYEMWKIVCLGYDIGCHFQGKNGFILARALVTIDEV